MYSISMLINHIQNYLVSDSTILKAIGKYWSFESLPTTINNIPPYLFLRWHLSMGDKRSVAKTLTHHVNKCVRGRGRPIDITLFNSKDAKIKLCFVSQKKRKKHTCSLGQTHFATPTFVYSYTWLGISYPIIWDGKISNEKLKMPIRFPRCISGCTLA